MHPDSEFYVNSFKTPDVPRQKVSMLMKGPQTDET